MKHHFTLPALTAVFMVSLTLGIKAQERQQTKVHVIIEENGKVAKDTSVTIDKSLCENEIQAIISGITGDRHQPCMVHQRQCMHGSAMTDTCRHMKKEMHQKGFREETDVEVRFVHGGPGKETVIVEEDGDVIIIRKGQGQPAHCMKEAGKMEADSLPCKRTKEVKIIEIRDDHAEVQEGNEKKVIEKKIIVTTEGEKAEKTIILESPGKAGKSKKETK